MADRGSSGGRDTSPGLLQSLLGALAAPQLAQSQASDVFGSGLLEEALNAYAENADSIEPWLEPFNNISRVFGSAVSGQNPFQDGGITGPMLSEALMARGVNPLLANAAEFLVPDPTGAHKVTDLIPLLGMIPFLRSLSKNPEAAARLTSALESGHAVQNVTRMGDALDDLEALGWNIEKRGLVPGLFSPEPDLYAKGGRSIGSGVDPHTPTGSPGVGISIAPGADGITVDWLSLPPEGGSSAGLREVLPLLDVADARGVTLYAKARPFGHEGADVLTLNRMYAELGFMMDERTGKLVRQPLPTDDAARAQELAARWEVTRQALPAIGEPPDSLTSYRTTTPAGIAGAADEAISFPLTEGLGQPQIPSRNTLSNLMRSHRPSAEAWLQALGFGDERVQGILNALESGDDDLARRLVRAAYESSPDLLPEEIEDLMRLWDELPGPDPILRGPSPGLARNGSVEDPGRLGGDFLPELGGVTLNPITPSAPVDPAAARQKLDLRDALDTLVGEGRTIEDIRNDPDLLQQLLNVILPGGAQ